MQARIHHGLLSAALLLGLSACAAHGKKDTERPNYSITMKVAEKLRDVGEAARAKKWDDALAKVNRILESDYLNPYERAAALQARAGIHAAQTHFAEALPDMEQAVALDAMPEQQQQDATYNLAQNYFLLERFSESADTFAKWEKNADADKITGDQLYVIASAFAQAKRFKEALPYAKRAVEKMDPPTEAALEFLSSVQYELKDEAGLTDTLKQLTKAFPTNKNHWLQLAQTYADTGDESNALATLDTAYDKKLLSEEKEILELARLYMRAGKPDRCTSVLDKHMKDGSVSKGQATYEVLASCAIAAKDVARASAAMAAAGEGVTNGQLFFDLAKLEAGRGEWAKARDAAAAAFARGGLAQPAEAHLLLGVAHYYTKRKDAALSSLAEAKKNPATQKCAEEWTQTVKSGKGSPTCLAAVGAASK